MLLWSLVSLAQAVEPVTAEVVGAEVRLPLQGEIAVLSKSKVVSGKSVELHFEEDWSIGYNQLWLVVGKVKAGVPSALEGMGMGVAFVQIQPGPNEADTRNVSGSCATSGSVTFDAKPKAGGVASGAVDVVITCSGVPELAAPLAVKGRFADVPVE